MKKSSYTLFLIEKAHNVSGISFTTTVSFPDSTAVKVILTRFLSCQGKYWRQYLKTGHDYLSFPTCHSLSHSKWTLHNLSH